MKKVLFGITSLTLGGAERVLVDIANKLSNKYDITIFTIYPNGEFVKDLNQNVKLVSMCNKQRNELNGIEKLMISLKLLINKKRNIQQEYKRSRYRNSLFRGTNYKTIQCKKQAN